MMTGVEKERTVVIHIGLPKCGSSALQSCLASNAQLLRSYNCDYPTDQSFYFSGSRNHLWLALSFGQPIPFFLTLQPKTLQRATQIIANAQTAFRHYVKSADANTILLSDEHFFSVTQSQHALAQFVAFFREIFGRVIVVCYVRPYLDRLCSAYNQSIKVGKKTAAFGVFAHEQKHSYLLTDGLNLISKMLGPENVIVKTLEPVQLSGGTVYNDFVAVGVSNGVTPELDTSALATNASIPQVTAELIRIIGSSVSDDALRNRIARQLRQNTRVDTSTSFAPCTQHFANSLRDFFATDARYLAENYFGNQGEAYLMSSMLMNRPVVPAVDAAMVESARKWLARSGYDIKA